MSNIIYPNSKTVHGAWLVDENALVSLNESLKKIYQILVQQEKLFLQRDGLLEKEEKERPYPYSQKQEITFTIILNDGTSIVKPDIESIQKELGIKDKLPVNLKATMRVHRMELEIELCAERRYRSYFKYYLRGFEECEDTKNDSISILEDWIEKYGPNKYLRYWERFDTVINLGLFVAMIVVLFMLSIESSQSYSRVELSPKASEILAEGVDATNLNQAIELILAKQYEYQPKNYQEVDNALEVKKLGAMVSILGLMILVIIYPRANIGIGKGKRKIKFWRGYLWVIGIGIPTMVVIPLIINLISSK